MRIEESCDPEADGSLFEQPIRVLNLSEPKGDLSMNVRFFKKKVRVGLRGKQVYGETYGHTGTDRKKPGRQR